MRQKLENPEEYSRLVGRRALELYADDVERTREQASTAVALTELDVPAEYLERAQAEVLRERADRARRARNVKATVAAVALGSLMCWAVIHRPQPDQAASRPAPPTIPTVVIEPATTAPGHIPLANKSVPDETIQPVAPREQPHNTKPTPPLFLDLTTAPNDTWTLQTNPGTAASLSFQKTPTGAGYATVQVAHFTANTGIDYTGEFWADLATINGTKEMTHYTTATFRARGAGLSKVRLILPVDDFDEWVSSPVALSADWATYIVRLADLGHYVLSNGAWRPRNDSPTDSWPRYVTAIVFQFGQYVNGARARGHADISDIVLR